MKAKKFAAIVFAGLFVYLSLYTWNLRTGYLDALSARTGLDVTGWVLRPGQWLVDRGVDFWERYIYLVGLKQENDRLQDEVTRLRLETISLAERAEATRRLERLLEFPPPEGWIMTGCRIVAHRMGPAGALETIVVDKGASSGVAEDTPVMSPDGVVGRVLRCGGATSTILLLQDPNSRIAVIGSKHRSVGVVVGMGPGHELQVRYMHINAELEPGELLVTSGLGGIFPKGLPVARVTSVSRSDIDLFLDVMREKAQAQAATAPQRVSSSS